MTTQGTVAIERVDGRRAQPDEIFAVLQRDGAVIVEDLLHAGTVDAVNAEVGEAVERADPDEDWFNPVLKAFNGPQTKVVCGVAGISPTFAADVLCHPLLLALADRVLLPACARYQLNAGQILQRGPGSPAQWLHRDEAVWSEVPRPAPQLQLATVIAFNEFTRDNGATRIVPGSHRWDERDRQATDDEVACAEMGPGAAVVYLGSTIHGGGANTTDVPRRGAHLSYCLGWLRTEENHYLGIPPAVAAGLPRKSQELLGYAVYDAIARGGAFLGQVRGQDPVELLARGEL